MRARVSLVGSVRALVLGLLLTATPLHAQERSRVVLLRPGSGEPPTNETLTRLDAELRAAGFDVVTVDRDVGADVRSSLEREAAGARAFAAIAILPARGGAAADVWIVDRATGKTLIRTVEARPRPGESAPSILAIRAVELLRASLLEADAPASPAAGHGVGIAPKPALPRDVSRWMAPPPPSPWALSLGAGVAWLQAFDGLGPAFAPSLRVSLGRGILAARLSIVGPAVGPSSDVGFGEVSIRQELAALEAVLSRRLGGTRLVPSAHVGVGGYHLAAVAALEPPYRGATDDAWAIFFATGVGLGVQATDMVVPHVDVQALFTEPRPVVTVGGETVGRAGRPSLLATMGVTVRLR